MLEAPVVMGVVNVTPDSFSDGGRFLATEDAVVHGRRLLAEGADILDIGGESTRPGATRPVVEEELGRVIPVIARLAAEGAVVSVDTMRAEVAAAAIASGARIVNDVSGGLADPAILDVVAESDATYVAMHWRAHGDRMDRFTRYDGPVSRVVAAELAARLVAIDAAGVPADRVILDPGLGFAKTAEQSWDVLADLGPLRDLGHRLLVGASHKRFLGHLLRTADGEARPVGEREAAHVAVLALLARDGVWGVRVHDVRAACDARAVVRRMEAADE